MKSLLLLAGIGFVSMATGFVPSSMSNMPSTLSSAADSMAGRSVELGGRVWDPLGLADLGSDKTLKWFRASEVKHCRVAMLATIGWATGCNGWGKIEFPEGVLPSDPWAALAATPSLGLLQIAIVAGIVEVLTETVRGTHYLNSEDGHVNPLMVENVDKRLKDKELKNGRLAMIGIFSFFLGNAIPGSVPLYPSEWVF
ncbi:hypothetical protein ScalyP_jg5899 [Parmales sp. scaly parma]|nr:hypothetical protein ScalyP_jg5899 [Parmales sp. scaly parma]